ncbi:hypothetical protein ONS95_014278 [Cadophora gregata]|uniref:uncharacterized protein n=1 Tax=Cadophora gregata TaxID=51156 RepID=UPI0026DA8867|nr:uncharacterized protein ONS95_014278 [Cadophora gregata]KAK0114036.1 hypothetical protein ONS96_014883 [Cadophora gregata f. sp. sojae]KAK0114796.1 hypothetical protein ONS95_014278 [Cadophora gregata]
MLTNPRRTDGHLGGRKLKVKVLGYHTFSHLTLTSTVVVIQPLTLSNRLSGWLALNIKLRIRMISLPRSRKSLIIALINSNSLPSISMVSNNHDLPAGQKAKRKDERGCLMP